MRWAAGEAAGLRGDGATALLPAAPAERVPSLRHRLSPSRWRELRGCLCCSPRCRGCACWDAELLLPAPRYRPFGCRCPLAPALSSGAGHVRTNCKFFEQLFFVVDSSQEPLGPGPRDGMQEPPQESRPSSLALQSLESPFPISL